MKSNFAFFERPRLRRLLRWCLGLGVFLFVAFNVIAFLQARAMTHYQPATARTTRLSQLSDWGKLRTVLAGPVIRRQSNTKTPADIGLAYQTIHFASTNGIQLEAWQIASQRAGAPCVLLFPGYGASKDTLLHAAQEFAQHGCELWLIDPRGIGGSDGSVTSVGFHEADDVAAAVREVRKTSASRPLVLYGTSMGAVAILRAVHRHSISPDALILECPFDRFTTTIGNRFAWLGLPRSPLAEGVAFWAGVQQGFNGLAHNPTTYARSVRCPTLLLQGAKDESVGLAHVHAVSRCFGPECRFELIPDGGHAFLVLRSNEAWRRSVSGFLAAQFPGK